MKGVCRVIVDSKKTSALLLAGLLLGGSLLMSAAFAKPPKKTPTKPSKPSAAAAIAAGKKVFEASSSGCGNCHAINGKGGSSGPDLSNVGGESKHTAAWLKVAVTDPKAHDPNSSMPAYADKIKGKDLTNLVAYLGSLKKK